DAARADSVEAAAAQRAQAPGGQGGVHGRPDGQDRYRGSRKGDRQAGAPAQGSGRSIMVRQDSVVPAGRSSFVLRCSSKRRPTMRRTILMIILIGIFTTLSPASAAQACGGFFCTNAPVDQSAERIIFAVNEAAGTIDAYVQINYTGSPDQFAWVVPVPNPP